MPSPFPGMDPYLEQPEVWPEFHNNLAAEIQGYLNRRIRPRYIARQVPVATYDAIAITPTRVVKPDVSVWQERGRQGSGRSGAATLTPPAVEAAIPLEYELTLFSVEIRTAGSRELVTAIEILSPVNKRPGHDAYRDYHRKRRGLLRSEANLLEIDLLRAGERPPVEPPPPAAPYYVVLSRASDRPRAPVWAIRVSDALPVVPVPLIAPDPDAALDLQEVVTLAYERGGYDSEIDYSVMPPPPWSAEEAAWIAERLRLTPPAG
jgi:hypothetical protein